MGLIKKLKGLWTKSATRAEKYILNHAAENGRIEVKKDKDVYKITIKTNKK